MIDAALSLGDIKKLRSIGIKTIIWFLATGAISATIGLILANIIKPGRGLQLGTAETAMEVKELPGIYQTLLDLIPSNPFQALTSVWQVSGRMIRTPIRLPGGKRSNGNFRRQGLNAA
ncbi:cation:dicarboxylase symporter family transporter [Clostridium sp.]|uniref:cation:dicarboxylate symporter family transporter n=1 Tax=Clostridium sp. TaxID=1506 RepID=UPI00307E7D4D